MHHTGPADQALAYVSWPGPDLVDERRESRRVQLLEQVFGLRVTEQIREREAISYTPFVQLSGAPAYYGGVRFAVVAPLQPGKIPQFYAAVDRIARDLQTRPVTTDELERARTPLIEALPKSRATNEYWMEALKEVLTKPHLVEQALNAAADYRAVTPADIQALARKYLKPEAAWRMTVTPASLEKPSPAAAAAGAAPK